MMPTPQLCHEIATRLRHATPELLAVHLVGSVARGEAGPESDVDLVLVLPAGADRDAVLLRARKSLRHLGVGFDLLLLTEADWAALAHSHGWYARELVRDARRLDVAA